MGTTTRATIRLTTGRELPLPPFNFAELEEWFAIGADIEAQAAPSIAASLAVLRRQAAVVLACLQRATPDLTEAEFKAGLDATTLNETLFGPVRRVNGLEPTADPPERPEAAAA